MTDDPDTEVHWQCSMKKKKKGVEVMTDEIIQSQDDIKSNNITKTNKEKGEEGTGDEEDGEDGWKRTKRDINDDDDEEEEEVRLPEEISAEQNKETIDQKKEKEKPFQNSRHSKSKKKHHVKKPFLSFGRSRRKKSARPGSLDYQMKFFGLQWRFLRKELEKETLDLPPVFQPPSSSSCSAVSSLPEKKAVLETYLRELKLTTVQDVESLESFRTNTTLPTNETVPSSAVPSQPQTETDATSTTVATASDSDTLTEADVFTALKHMQIFERVQEVHPETPRRHYPTKQEPIREYKFVPHPPRHSKRSSISLAGSVSTRGLRASSHDSALHSTDSKSKEKKVQTLLISKQFKQYALEKGLRVA